MEQISTDSRVALDILAHEWFDVIRALHPTTAVRYLIVTVERSSGIVYTPVSNFPDDILKIVHPEFAIDLVGAIREKYLFPIHERGPIRQLLRAVRDPGIMKWESVLLVPVNEDGNGHSPSVFDSAGVTDVTSTALFKDYFDKNVILFTGEWISIMKKVVAAIRPVDGPPHQLYFVLRPEKDLRPPQVGDVKMRLLPNRSHNFDLMQIGVAVTAEVPSEAFKACATACLASGLATFSILYEKERYYDRAARQCTAGEILKYGTPGDINNQYDKMLKLKEMGALNIPFPIPARSVPLPSQGRDFGFYSMPRVALRKLADTLVWGREFERYELAALMRATVARLRKDYWGPVELRAEGQAAPMVLAPLFMAGRAISKFRTSVMSTVADINHRHIVEHRGGVTLHGKEQLEQVQGVIDAIVGSCPLDLSFAWQRDYPFWSGTIEAFPKLGEEMNALSAAAKTIDTPQQPDILKIKNTIHGDPQFLNLFIDSSIPEDPLIISIDPLELTDIPQKEIESQADDKVSVADLRIELTRLKEDVAWDIAKCILSTACLYALAVDQGLRLRMNGNACRLSGSADVTGPLENSGGLSGANLIEVGAGVPYDSLKNHLVCADALVREFLQLFVTDTKSLPELRSINIGLIRLWALTVRAAFSGATSWFSRDMTIGCVLFLLSAAYLQQGHDVVLGIIKKRRLSEQSAQEELVGVLRWKALEEALKRQDENLLGEAKEPGDA